MRLFYGGAVIPPAADTPVTASAKVEDLEGERSAYLAALELRRSHPRVSLTVTVRHAVTNRARARAWPRPRPRARARVRSSRPESWP